MVINEHEISISYKTLTADKYPGPLKNLLFLFTDISVKKSLTQYSSSDSVDQNYIKPCYRCYTSSLLSSPTSPTPNCLVLVQVLPAAGHFLTLQRRSTGKCALWRFLAVMSTASAGQERSG